MVVDLTDTIWDAVQGSSDGTIPPTPFHAKRQKQIDALKRTEQEALKK
jgi:hypothetical protein